jgi:hypothetical protein
MEKTYTSKEVAEILNVSDKSVRRYLTSYFSIENGAYQISEKMLDVLKDEYLDVDVDIVVQTYSVEQYEKLSAIIIENPFLKVRAEILLSDLEYYRKSMTSKERQMEMLLLAITNRKFIEED